MLVLASVVLSVTAIRLAHNYSLEDGSQLTAAWQEDSYGEWFHVGATYDGQTLIVYRNGQEMARSVGASVQAVRLSSAPIRLGLSLEGLTDEVALFNRNLSASAIQTLARFAPVFNQAPQVDAGPDVTVSSLAPILLRGHAHDDGLPIATQLTSEWMQLSGPSAAIASPSQAQSMVTLTTAGRYEFQLRASDGLATSLDTVVVTVDPAASAAVDAGPDLAVWSYVDTALPDLDGTWSLAAAPHARAAQTVSLNNGVFQAQIPGRYRLRLQDGSAADDITMVVANYYDTAPGLLADYHFDADVANGSTSYDYHRLEHDTYYSGAATVLRDDQGIANGPWSTSAASTGDDLQPAQGGASIVVQAVAGESGQWFGIGGNAGGWQLAQDDSTMVARWHFVVSGGSQTVELSASLSPGVAQQWHLLSDGRTVQLWRDGVLADTQPIGRHEPATVQTNGPLQGHDATLSGVLVEAQVVEVAQPPVAAMSATN